MLTTTMSVLAFTTAVLLAQGPTPPTAAVNDPMSHGAVGDNLLSLDEAIRVANGTLAIASLSSAEQARISGGGAAVTRIEIDAGTTPTIALQGPLTGVTGQGMAVGPVTIEGLPAGSSAPVLAGGAHAHVLQILRHLVTVRGLAITGGQVGIDARMPSMGMPMTEMAMVMECAFQGQTTAAVRMTGIGSDATMLMVRESSFANMPLGFLLDDQTQGGGRLMSENERVTFDGVTLGCRVLEAGSGGLSMWMLFRSRFQNGTTLCEHRRTPTSTQQFMFRIVHSDAICQGDVTDVQGNTAGLTMFHHHHGDFVAGAGHKAFWVYPRTAEFDVHGSEMVFDGDVSIGAGLTSPRIWQQNNLYKNGTITYDIDGALPNLVFDRFENCTIDVPAAARSPVVARQCQLSGTDAHSAAFLAPITLQGCFRTGGTLTGFASEVQPAPAAFLGTTAVSPPEPQVGATLQLATDLPFGIGLVWDVATSYARPTTTAEPFRFYGDPATVVVLPALVLFQSQLTIPLPNTPSLAGLEFYAQGIALPLLGQSWVPGWHLPRGGLFRLRS